MKKKILAGLLSLAMVFSMMPATLVSAEEMDTNTTQVEIQTENEQNTESIQDTEKEAFLEEMDTDTVSEETQVQTSDSEAIEALQSRINALPTVDEFIAMADGTTVEDSTLNQAQFDVYNEAQAIAEELDKLTDEEQGQLDTGKLETLFEYFNGMMEETALTPGSTVTLTGSYSQYITKAGTYNIKASSGISTSYNLLYIQNTSVSDNIVINIQGNITANDSAAIISVNSPCNLTINGDGYTVENKGSNNVIMMSVTGATVTVNGGTYKVAGTNPVISGGGKGTLNLNSCTIHGGGSGGSIYVEKLKMTNTTVESSACGITGANMTAIGCTFKNCTKAIDIWNGDSVTLSGNTVFSGNTNDIYLRAKAVVSLSNDYDGNAKVTTADTVSANTQRQITTANTSAAMLEKISSANSSYAVNYDTSGKYLYLWQHKHTWSYSASGNTITAKCTSDSKCDYYSSGLTLTLTAPDMTYTGSAYDKAEIENNITSVTGATAGTIKYYKTDAENTTTGGTALSSAPTDAGYYYASVIIGGATATADFTINKAEVTKPSADETTFTYNGNSQTYNIAASDKYTVTGNTRTDAGTQTVTVALKNNYKWSDGSTDDLTFTFTIAKADLNLSLALKNWVYGTTPSKSELGNYKGDGTISYFYKKQGEADTEYKSITEADFNTIVVGKYTLKASVAEGANYNAATAESDFAVTKQPITVSVSMDGWTYGEEAKTPSVTVKAEDSDITSSYEKSQITYTYYTDSECKNEVVPKNAGTYYVKAEVEATDNYSDGSAISEFTIAKKALTATVTADNKTYDGTTDAVISADILNDDLISGDSITITGLTGTFDNKNAETEKKVTVDSSKAEITGTGVENYDITIGTEAKASINKLTAEFNWSKTDITYTGSEQSVTAEVKNAISGDTFTLTYDGNKQTAVGDYTAKVTALGNDNYELPSEENVKTAWKISYLAKGTAEVSGTKGDNDWYVTKVTITPEAGYEISANGTDWKAFLAYDAQGSQTAEYYLKETTTGFISDKKTADFKIDTELPTGEIKIEDNGFTGFLNAITFKHFFKNTVDVTITGADGASGVAKIEYQKVAKGASFDKDGTWTEGRSFSMTANDKSAVYARITDNAGNSVIINSDGVVVYTDATTASKENFVRKSNADLITDISANGNTIASVLVKNTEDESAVTARVDASSYEIKEDRLVLKASYLKTLAAGTYTFTVSYNPYGEAYTDESKGDAPDTSVITLTVNKAAGSITDISDISKVYDGNAVTAPTFTTANDRGTDDTNITIEYKKQGAEDSTYTSEAPENSGDYVVRITVKADEDYEAVVITKEFSIQKKEMKVSADGYTGTYDGQTYGITVSVTEPVGSAASNVKVVYGTKDAEGKITYSENQITHKDAGEYTVYYKVTADNYEDAEGSAAIQIAPKTVSLVWSDTEFTYDGKAHKPSAKVNENDVIGSDSVEVTVAGEQKNAGSYTAQAVALSNGNYALPQEVKSSFNIKKASAVVTVDNAAKHIGKNDLEFTYKVTGLISGEALKDIKVTRAEGETAGDYDITATTEEGSNANYDVTFVAGKLTIEDHIKAETPVIENRVEAACTEDGSYDEVYYCTVDDCKAELERVHQTIPAAGHKYGEPEFTWSEDYSTATAVFTCANDKSHIETVEAAITSETVAATCETAGKTVYTAAIEFNGKTYTDSEEVAIQAIGHDYANPVFVWSEDYSTATAAFTCTHDAAHVSEKECEVTVETADATCTTEGTVTYTASVTLAGKTYTDVKEAEIPALGHDWSEWVKAGNREKSTCLSCGQVKYRNIDTADTGNLEKDAEVAPGSPITEAALDNDKSELVEADGIFTAEEKAAIENGADARVWLEISAATDISDADKQKVEAEAKEIMGSDISKVVYFDADLFKSVTKDGTTTKSQITEPGTEIEVSVSLPESLVQADSTISRAYKIIRLHNGEVDSFDAAFDKETGTLTFQTDRFSTYAIAFTDTQLVTGITVNTADKTLTKKGETVQLTAAVTPDNAANKKVTWTSSDNNVATVDGNGLVTAVANGTAVITATTEDGGKTAAVKITVNIPSDEDDNKDDNNNNGGNNSGNSNAGDNNNGGNNNSNSNAGDNNNGGNNSGNSNTGDNNNGGNNNSNSNAGNNNNGGNNSGNSNAGDNNNANNNDSNSNDGNNNANNDSKDNGNSDSASDNTAAAPDNSGNVSDVTENSQSAAPQTDDTLNVALWTMLLMAGLAELAGILVKRKKKLQ